MSWYWYTMALLLRNPGALAVIGPADTVSLNVYSVPVQYNGGVYMSWYWYTMALWLTTLVVTFIKAAVCVGAPLAVGVSTLRKMATLLLSYGREPSVDLPEMVS